MISLNRCNLIDSNWNLHSWLVVRQTLQNCAAKQVAIKFHVFKQQLPTTRWRRCSPCSYKTNQTKERPNLAVSRSDNPNRPCVSVLKQTFPNPRLYNTSDGGVDDSPESERGGNQSSPLIAQNEIKVVIGRPGDREQVPYACFDEPICGSCKLYARLGATVLLNGLCACRRFCSSPCSLSHNEIG